MLTYSLSNLFRSVFVFQCCLLNQKRVYVLVCIYFRDICFLDSHIFVLLFSLRVFTLFIVNFLISFVTDTLL